MKCLRALRKLNNNAVVCEDSTGQEVIALGKGLGFGELPREIALGEIERTFYDLDSKNQNVMRDLPADVVLFAAKLIDIAANELPYALSPNAVLLLADHIAYAIERTRRQLQVRMPLAYDVRQMYPQEYRIGIYAVGRIRKEFRIGLIDEEAVGIALNLVNAKAVPEIQAEQQEARLQADMLEDATEIVESYFHMIVDRDSFNFARYATHLQYLFDRIRHQKNIDSENLRLYRDLRDEFPEVSNCVEQISAHIEKQWNNTLSEEEKLYLVLHVNRICAKEGL